MRIETARIKFSNIWYLRDFDFRPMPLMRHPNLYSIKQDYINEENGIKIFKSLEDAVKASYEVRKLLKIEDAENVLNILKDVDGYKEAWMY